MGFKPLSPKTVFKDPLLLINKLGETIAQSPTSSIGQTLSVAGGGMMLTGAGFVPGAILSATGALVSTGGGFFAETGSFVDEMTNSYKNYRDDAKKDKILVQQGKLSLDDFKKKWSINLDIEGDGFTITADQLTNRNDSRTSDQIR